MNKESTFEKQLERLKTITGCSTQSALATVLDTSQLSISVMCKKRKLTSTDLLTLVEKKRVNPEWIKTGRGKKHLKLSKLEISPEEIAKSVITSPDILSQVPSCLLIKELYQRSDELQEECDSRMKNDKDNPAG